MPVVVDGNNLIFAARAVEDVDLLVGRSMLCDALGEWSERRNEQVHVVFDGPQPAAPLAEQIGHPRIQVSFSGAGRSADDVLIELLETHSAARRMVVVSTDRAITKVAKRRRAKPIRSEEFWAALKKDLSRPIPERVEPEEKEFGLSPDATSQWLEEFGLNELPDT